MSNNNNNNNKNLSTFREPKIVSTHINCEYESIGKLIGARGGRIEELRTLTECQITIKKGDPSNTYCIVEIVGAPDKVAYAVPLIKMVLGSGDAVMTIVRSILPGHQNQLQSQNQLPNQSQNNEIGETTNTSTLLSAKYLESPSHRATTSSLELGTIAQQVDGNVDISNQLQNNETVESNILCPSPQPNTISNTISSAISNTVSTSVILPPAVENVEDTYVSSDEDEDQERSNDNNNNNDKKEENKDNNKNNDDNNNNDEEDDDNDDKDQFKSPKNSSKSTITPTKYNISPPPSPPPSTVFPEYFIQSHPTKLTESITYPNGKFSNTELQEISLFSRCKISILETNYNRRPDQITLQFQGYPDQRELAKLLIDAIVKPGQFRSPGLSQKDGLDGVVQTMDCPPHFIPVLIGPGGMTIESIQTQSGTKILINENIDEVLYCKNK